MGPHEATQPATPASSLFCRHFVNSLILPSWQYVTFNCRRMPPHLSIKHVSITHLLLQASTFCYINCNTHLASIHTAVPTLQIAVTHVIVDTPKKVIPLILPYPIGVIGGQLKTWATTILEELKHLSGPRIFGCPRRIKDFQWDRTGLSCLGCPFRDVVHTTGDAGSTHPEWTPPKVQAS